MKMEDNKPVFDFNELDRKLDRALERETVESLNEFLDSKRNNVFGLCARFNGVKRQMLAVSSGIWKTKLSITTKL